MSDSASKSQDNGTSATDIITYVGVPLAVLGVLPILYNTFATLGSLSRIRRMLRRSRLTALTRSDVVNRVIEIELPRYAVKPWDRFQDQEEYWSLSRHPSSIPGGSWTTFNWKTNTIGIKTQRVEYADQVRQPQVEVAFDDLVSYLLDLGAVPDPQGWKLLRSTGLWTPVGCSLMTAPNGRDKALTVGPQDDADGNLSLTVTWSEAWTTRDHEHLPPYWLRLPAPPQTTKSRHASRDGEKGSEDGIERTTSVGPSDWHHDVEAGSIEAEEATLGKQTTTDITCQIATSGITGAYNEDNLRNSLDISHLRIAPGATTGTWFASAATAYGTTSQTVLWNYKIPDDVLAFSRRDSVPCGVLVMLDIVDDAETPDWATRYNDHGASLDVFMRRNREHQAAVMAENKLPPAERQAAMDERARREMLQRVDDLREKSRADQERAEKRMLEALQSPKWSTKLVAQHCFAWLRSQSQSESQGACCCCTPDTTAATPVTARTAAGSILHRMVNDATFATGVARMLNEWRAWADIGGMRRADYQTVRESKAQFAHAAVLLSLVADTSDALEGTLAMDLQECLRLWNKVRLG